MCSLLRLICFLISGAVFSLSVLLELPLLLLLTLALDLMTPDRPRRWRGPLLGVIIGHAELAMEQVDPAGPLIEDLQEKRLKAEQ